MTKVTEIEMTRYHKSFSEEEICLSRKAELSLEEQNLIEILRTRMNVLNTSVFLLTEKMSDTDKKANEYIQKINSELEHIRSIIMKFPEPDREE